MGDTHYVIVSAGLHVLLLKRLVPESLNQPIHTDRSPPHCPIFVFSHSGKLTFVQLIFFSKRHESDRNTRKLLHERLRGDGL